MSLHAAPPNILLITADDIGLHLGCYGDATVPTPHLDALAARGTRFDRGYVPQASCSPARAAILTGFMPMQNGQWGLAYRDSGYQLKPGVVTLPDLLRQAGYLTGIMGKLHVVPHDAFPFEWERSNDFGGPETVDTQDPAAVGRETAAFLALAREQGRPFFLMANLYDPHRVYRHQRHGYPKEPLGWGDVAPFPFQQIDTPEIREQIAAYYNAISRLDTCVGELLKALSHHSYTDNTLIIFLGDNGPPFARAKISLYEAGTRVPFIITPPQGSAISTSDALISAIDLAPTILTWAGVALPPGLPGHSLWPLLRGESITPRSFLITEFTAHTHWNFHPARAITDGRYKLILRLLPELPNPATNGEGDGALATALSSLPLGTARRAAWERFMHPPAVSLFDLENDPHEWYDLADDPALAGVRSRLLDALDQHRREWEDPFLDPEFLAAEARKHAALQERAAAMIERFDRRQRDQALPEDSPLRAEVGSPP
jgi:N-sulfoglucosamine sulfohydrolase